MNGFGQFVQPIVSFQIYWAALAVAFALVANALWVRGMETQLKKRAALAWATRSRAAHRRAHGVLARLRRRRGLHLLEHEHPATSTRPATRTRSSRPAYEKTYRKWWGVPQPVIEGVKVAATSSPRSAALDLRGTYALENESAIRHLADRRSASRTREDRQALVRARREALARRRATSASTSTISLRRSPRTRRPRSISSVRYDEPRASPTPAANTHVVYNGTFFNSEVCPAHRVQRRRTSSRTTPTATSSGSIPAHMPPAGDPHRVDAQLRLRPTRTGWTSTRR